MNIYPLLSILLLIMIPVSVFISGSFIDTGINWVVAIGLLLPLFVAFCFVFTTIRGMHRANVFFWTLASTYVNMIVGFLASLVALFSYLTVLHMTHGAGLGHLDPFTLASFIAYGIAIVWSLWYNTKKSGSFLLAISMIIVQSLGLLGLITLFQLWGNRRGVEHARHEEEFG